MKKSYADVLQSFPCGIPKDGLKQFSTKSEAPAVVTRKLHSMGVDPVNFKKWCQLCLATGRAEIVDGHFRMKGIL